MNRIRITFQKGTRFTRDAAAKKYVYNYHLDDWVGYMLDNIYYNTKHEAFGRIKNHAIVGLDPGTVLFDIRAGRVYDLHGYCIGHIF